MNERDATETENPYAATVVDTVRGKSDNVLQVQVIGFPLGTYMKLGLISAVGVFAVLTPLILPLLLLAPSLSARNGRMPTVAEFGLVVLQFVLGCAIWSLIAGLFGAVAYIPVNWILRVSGGLPGFIKVRVD